MVLSGSFVRRIVGGGIISRSVECRKCFMHLKSTLTSPKLFVSSGVSPSTTDEKIREAFSPFGNLVEAKVNKDRFSGISKGFAIVTYDNIEQAQRARKRMNFKRWGDTVLLVETESEFSKQEPVFPKSGCSIYLDLNDLDESEGVLDLTTEDKLRAAFAPFGNVLEARIFKNGPLGNSTRRAIVTYGTKEPEKAQGALDDNRLGHHTVVPVEPKKFKPSEQEKTHSDTSYIARRTSGYTQSTHYHTEAEAEGGKYTDKGEVKKQIIKKGDIISLKDLLFTKNRDYLVKNNHEHDFGASGYPFSDERLEFIRAEDDAAAKQSSLKALLATPELDYVISNKGDKVQVDTLEDKVVALYFYHADYANHYLTKTLKLAKNNDKFEVVLIYITESGLYDCRSYGERSLWKVFMTMPWLAMPYRDECCKKLRRVFKLSCNYEEDPIDELVIISPHAEFIEPFGDNILFEYGISAYPFTFNKVVELEIEKIKHLKLEMLWDKNTVFRRNNGSQVSFPELFGKRVMLVLERIGGMESNFSEHSSNAYFLIMLKGRYLQTKGTDDEFEVIRILADNLEFSTSEPFDLEDQRRLASLERDLGDNNWILCLASELKENICSSDYWYGRSIDDLYLFLPVLAFDRDGRLVRKANPSFEDIEFPFYAGGLENEMLSQLTKLMI